MRRCRQRLLAKWWATSEQLLAEGAKRALQVEAAYWASRQQVVRVTPSGRIIDSCGKELTPPSQIKVLART